MSLLISLRNDRRMHRLRLSLLLVAVILLSVINNLNAQQPPDQVYVDSCGVLRWSSDSTELHGFGVNYTLPFAHEYRMAIRMGVDPETAIKNDVYHMARLDLDLYRVHVWDTEISDTLGNLIDNEHMRLFDFAISEMKKRGMHFIITPIAFWGNGWPEPDEDTPGFSHKYGKENCLTDNDAIQAQENYLGQFLNHVNRYTGIAYRDDPAVIAFEVSNEPHHDQAAEKVTAYINNMVRAIRKTGCTKPVFYNMSHSIHLYKAYLDADIQGGTFQWYPTGLVANHMIRGNFLPQVSSYDIPFADDPGFRRMAKIVYEFDPADAAGNILYPAMAIAFRRAGMQLATQFAYDAMFLAPYNTNYGTHFMNLAYAPQKAISLKIASAVFHNVEMYGDQDNETAAGALTISYPDDLAQWITDKKFFYSNNTDSRPPRPSGLNEIAGYGSSPLVKYTGTGAYFLDRLGEGIWRLEIMPDAYWIDDPYGPARPDRQKAAVLHAEREMTITLPDLTDDFAVKPVSEGNGCHPQPADGKIKVIPGVYLLVRNGVELKITPDSEYRNIKVGEYFAPVTNLTVGEYIAPATNLTGTVLRNDSPDEALAGKPLVPDNPDLILWDAEKDWETSLSTWSPAVGLKPATDGKTVLSVRVREQPAGGNNNSGDQSFVFKSFFGDRIAGRRNEMAEKTILAMKYENHQASSQPVELGLTDNNGTVFAGDAILEPGSGIIRIPIKSFTRVPYIILPRPYPEFLPFRADMTSTPFDLSSAETLQVVISNGDAAGPDLSIEKIWLE